MNGPIAQAVALVCHANASLRSLKADRFFPSNSTAQFCEFVKFVDAPMDANGQRTERDLAPDPDAWFQWLRANSIRRVWLARQPSGDGSEDHRHAGCVGGGGNWWLLVEQQSGGSLGWLGRWTGGNREAPDRRVWHVTYGKLGPSWTPSTAGAYDVVAAARNQLTTSLEAILKFSKTHADGAFAEQFERALATLRTGVRHGYHTDLAPPGALSKAAADLIDACQSAWVFGGMGWWNDQGFDGAVGREFERVSVEHFTAVCESIAVAANQTVAP